MRAPGCVIWHNMWPISEGLIDDASGHSAAAWRCGTRGCTGKPTTPTALSGRSFGTLAVGCCLRRLEQELRRDRRAAGGKRQSDRRHFRRGRRRARFCGRLRRDHGKTGVALLDHSRSRRIRLRELARRYLPARRRHHLDAGHLRSRKPTRCTGRPAIRARTSTAACAPATICTPTACWPSIRTPEN